MQIRKQASKQAIIVPDRDRIFDLVDWRTVSYRDTDTDTMSGL